MIHNMKRMISALLLLLVHLSVAYAHHGIFAFDHDQEIQIMGKISKLQFINPHAWVHLDVIDENGETETWRCEMRSATILKRSGWSADMFQVGETVTIKASPPRRSVNDCYLTTITFSNGVTYDRYAQINKDKPVAVQQLSKRLANGNPNINGDWAAEQNVLTDPTGVSGAFVPLSVADQVQAGGELPEGTMPFPGSRGFTNISPEVFFRLDGLTEAGAKVYETFDPFKDNPRLMCEPTSIIFDWTFDTEVNRIIQSEDKITLLYGFMPLERIIHLDRNRHPDNITPSISGYSIGRWENDVLIVDTIGFEPGLLSVMGSDGFKPNSEQLRVTERFSLNEDGSALIREYTAEDPEYLKQAYTGRDMVLRADYPYEPPVCEPGVFSR